MTSTIKVNNIKDTGDNNMVVKCGSTLTLGKHRLRQQPLLLHQEKDIFVIQVVEHLQLIYQVHLLLVTL